MKNVRKKRHIVFLVLCIVFSSLMFFVGYGVPVIGRQSYTEEKTNEYTAIYQSWIKEGEDYVLYLNNCKCTLTVKSTAIINQTEFNNLTNGEKITFRSLFDFEALSQKEYPIEIVSLKTDSADIVTLESSKTAVTQAEIKIKVTCTVFSVISLIGAVICILFIAGIFPINQKKNI